MVGQTVSHYKIVRQLGAGGMGVVYAAEDPRLGRQVALKFVPEELAHDPHALERLRSEARTASGLNHPNICTIYDIGEHQGRPFIVMELLKGQTLRECMTSRPLKVHETVDIGIQVADALYWAHTRDVIHRDIKPANLFLADQGQLKILDFGLAKLVQAKLANEMTVAPTIDLTAVGVALGTVAYMSPEQVSGDTLDRRTDLFSLGVVLYECATGQQPFKGKTSAVILASILTQAPPPPISINAETPLRLQEIIHNCLEKDRELRYQDAAALRTDLRRLKRDLESGASGAMRTAAAAVLSASGASAVLGDTASARSGQVIAAGDPARVPSGSVPVQISAPPATGGGKGLLLAGGGALVAAGLVSAFFLMRSSPADPPAPAATVALTTAQTRVESAPGDGGAATVDRATASLQSGNVRAALVYAEDALRANPDQPEAARVRNEARAAIARFDQAIADAVRLLAAGDAEGATRALNVAKGIDANAAPVAALASQVGETLNAQAAGRRAADQAAAATAASAANNRRTPPLAPAAPARTTSAPASAASVPTTPAPSAPVAAANQSPPASLPSAPPVPAPSAPVATPPARPAEPPPVAVALPDPAPDRRAAPPPASAAAPVEDDEAIIRRLVATYARAIENKDLALFRTVKPNITPDEQRRIEEGFRAVTSQRVAVTIVAIERRGPEATVRLRRQDTIQASGRTQTANSQQVMTLIRSASGWVIREIGR